MLHQSKKQRFSIMAALIVIAFAFMFSSCWYGAELGTLVKTDNGEVQGFEDGNDTWSWKGIPFAKPPVDDLRWKAPQDPDSWDGVRDATEYCDICPQYDGNMFGEQTVIGNEDCLYLNIWRPRTQKRNLPVHFWIHGGGNSIGFAVMSDGKNIAGNGNMVVVTIQYRLGPFGWFTHPGIRHGVNPLDDSGNYGTLDIIKALKWVKRNIEAFGGNPHNVMIVGESAGGMNVYTMLISRLANGLFQKAMTESGGFWTSTVEIADDEAEAALNSILAADGLSEVPDGGNVEAYLKGKSTEEIMHAYTPGAGGIITTSYSPDPMGNRLGGYLDGYVLPLNGRDALANPCTYNKVPMIAGSNKEETKLFFFPLFLGGFMDAATYQEYCINTSNEWIDGAVDTPVTMMTSNKKQPPIYAYQLNYGAYNEDGYNAWPMYPVPEGLVFGACHALDVPFFWGDFAFSPLFADLFREVNQEGYEGLSDAMMEYVANFAHTGHPGNVDGVLWKRWSNKEGKPKRILFDANDTDVLIEMSNE